MNATLELQNRKFIDVQNVEQTFKTAKGDFQALRDINLQVAKGEFVALIGRASCRERVLYTV